MRRRIRQILVTGGAGFIGSEFVRQALRFGYKIAVVDKLTYAGNMERLSSLKKLITFYKVDICNKSKLVEVFSRVKPVNVIHFAAETHVDRSIAHSLAFIKTNVEGTQVLLDVSRKFKIRRQV